MGLLCLKWGGKLDFSLLFFYHWWSSIPSWFPGMMQSYNSNLIWLRFTESWFNSISITMQHLQNTKFTFPETTQVGQYCWKPAEWNMDPEARGRDLGITRQILSKDACHWLPPTGTKGWQESQRGTNNTYLMIEYETFYFQNGLRSERNAAKHADSLNAEGLQCAL